jgi:hypothetical protein
MKLDQNASTESWELVCNSARAAMVSCFAQERYRETGVVREFRKCRPVVAVQTDSLWTAAPMMMTGL